MMLADEMENGIHHSVLRELWQRVRLWLREWREWNVQFVATTLSAKCIEAAMAAFADDPDSLAIHKLFADGESGRIKAAAFTGETLEGTRDLRLEVR